MGKLSGATQLLRRSRPPQPADLDHRRFLFKLLEAGSEGAEIGVWEGDFSAQLLYHVRPRRLHLVDPWAFQPDIEGAWYGGAKARSQRDMDAIYRKVRRRFRGQPVAFHRLPSTEAAAGLPDASLDWVYIDGNHFYDYVRDDIAAWWPKVVAGGLLICDDYYEHPFWGDGVVRAVDEFVQRDDCEVVIDGRRRQYVIRKRTRE